MMNWTEQKKYSKKGFMYVVKKSHNVTILFIDYLFFCRYISIPIIDRWSMRIFRLWLGCYGGFSNSTIAFKFQWPNSIKSRICMYYYIMQMNIMKYYEIAEPWKIDILYWYFSLWSAFSRPYTHRLNINCYFNLLNLPFYLFNK